MTREPDWDNYPNFARHEFVCPCGCGQALMVPAFMDRLQGVRTEIGVPLVVSSGFRCPDYNAQVSSTGRNGPHTLGRAVDLAVRGPLARRVVGLAIARGFTGIGIRQHGDHNGRFVHLDDLNGEYPGPRPWIWSYT